MALMKYVNSTLMHFATNKTSKKILVMNTGPSYDIHSTENQYIHFILYRTML